MLTEVIKKIARKIGLGKYAAKVLKKVNYTREVNVFWGGGMRIPSIHGIKCDISEPWMTNLLVRALRKQSGVFMDVGVNLGQTLVKVKAIESGREYIGFEPNPLCVSYVQNIIKENRLQNTTLVPVGLFTKDCVLKLDLFSESGTDSAASLISDFRPGEKIHSSIFVPVFSFDSLAEFFDEKAVGIIKIDVEGAELEVIKSLLNVIRRDHPILLMEVLPVYSAENTFRRIRQDELESIFKGEGYRIFRIQKSKAGLFLAVEPVEEIGIHSDLGMSDYLIVPQDLAADWQASINQPA